MTVHYPNLDIDLKKFNQIRIVRKMPAEANIKYSFLIQEGKEKEAITQLEELIRELSKIKETA